LFLCYNRAVKISDIGEFGLIELITDIVNKSRKPCSDSWRNLITVIGDDAAVYDPGDKMQLVTTDSLVQDIHFSLQITDWEALGWKAMAVNLSDIAAMGGIPNYALFSLSLPGDIEVSCIEKLYCGFIQAADIFDVAIAGGNINSAREVVITVTLLGSLEARDSLTRGAAKPGDKVAITGYTGLSNAGLRMLTQHLSIDAEAKALFREAHLKPKPRVVEGQKLLGCGVKAAIDISDGLISDLTHVCKASRVGAVINMEDVPIHPCLQRYFQDDCNNMVLAGGEDYELLFTAGKPVIERLTQSTGVPFMVIGEIVEGTTGSVKVVDNNSSEIMVKQAGWDHFKQ
jgi:thiamine-monophosphate kinase